MSAAEKAELEDEIGRACGAVQRAFRVALEVELTYACASLIAARMVLEEVQSNLRKEAVK